jgi:DNA-binding LacI/PurR family transcriptional regulator
MVRRTAEHLHYIPNAGARSLVLRSTRTLGLMIPDMTDPIHGQVATAFEQAALARGYGVIVANGFADQDRERSGLRAFTMQRVDGTALLGSTLDQEEVVATMARDPVVLVGSENLGLAGTKTDLPAGCIRADEASGVAAMVAHLLARGRRRIGYVNGPSARSNITRRDATLRALAAAGMDGRQRQYHGGALGWTNAAAVAGRIAQDRPDAVVCFDDKLALAVMDGLREFGVRVPDDIAVVGFDDIPFAALANPRLTTVAPPSAQMGRRAVQMLMSAFESGTLPASEVLPVRLVVRESSGGDGVAPATAV